jgi:hypothetical protein
VNLNELAKKCHEASRSKGWWDDCLRSGWTCPVCDGGPGNDCACTCIPTTKQPLDPAKVREKVPEKIALIHSELSEALEEYRLPESERGGPLSAILYECMHRLGGMVRVTDDGDHASPPHGGKHVTSTLCPRFQRNGWQPRMHKPVGFMSELADVAIRVLDLAGALGLDPSRGRGGRAARLIGIVVQIAQLHDDVVMAHRMLRDPSLGITGFVGRPHVAFADVLDGTEALAVTVGGDLWGAVEIKMAYNATRAHRHGGKAC